MTEDSKRGEWSLVVVAVSPAIWATSTNIEHALGRRGLDLLGLALKPEGNVPAELYTGLTREDALRLAADLSSGVLTLQAVPTAETSGLRHRASELWATRCTDTYCFTELDNIITILGAVNARDNLDHTRQPFPDWASWQIERALNHIHVDNAESDAECIEDGEKTTAELVDALKQAYPGRAFTISHIPGTILSFWQTTPESPTSVCLPYDEKNHEKAWCRNCGNVEYERVPYVDCRFPEAEWGKCKTCGAQILVRKYERLTFIN